MIEGNYNTHTGIQTYLGIPFAQPPVGPLRWKAPQPLANWSGVKETKRFGPRPMQTIVWGDMHSRSNGVSEDCLYLNVWTPAKRNTKDLPVLVYFYGGGNVAGDGSEPRYDGESAGSIGVSYQMASPLAKNLITGAIGESGAPHACEIEYWGAFQIIAWQYLAMLIEFVADKPMVETDAGKYGFPGFFINPGALPAPRHLADSIL